MSFIQYPFFQLSIGLLAGIILQSYIPTTFPVLWLFPIPWFGLLFIWKASKNSIISPLLFSLVLLISMTCLGYIMMQFGEPKNSASHFIHEKFEGKKAIELVILEELKESLFQKKYIATTKMINGEKRSGKVLLNIEKDSMYDFFSADDLLLVYAIIEPLKEPQNPGQFSYKDYLEKDGVFGQINCNTSHVLNRKETRKTVFGIAQKTQKYLVEKLKRTSLNKENKSIIAALILGERKGIETNLYEAYANAGAIHILAVSGLHVGILFFLFNILLKPFEWIFITPFIKQIFIVFLLWSFAFMTGLSPSVVRAVTMFSFFSLAHAFKRKNDPMNTLFISLFFILIVRPNWVFHIGFQLSYLAVFFILWLLPLFEKLYRSRWWLVRKIYTLLCVSICAQIGVAPLSMYYFHQFPGLFLITNLIILPILSFVLLYGLLIIFLAVANIHILFLEIGLDKVISTINGFVYWIANQNQFLFKNIAFSSVEIVCFYIIIISFGLLWKKQNKKYLILSLLSVLCFFVVEIPTSFNTSERLVILHKNNQSIIALEQPGSIEIFNNNSSDILKEWPIKNWQKTTDKNFTRRAFENIFEFDSKKFIVVDSMGTFPQSRGNYIILTQNARVNLNRMIDSIKPNLVIADGSNYKQLVQLWKSSCEKRNIPFYSTYENGALEFKKTP